LLVVSTIGVIVVSAVKIVCITPIVSHFAPPTANSGRIDAFVYKLFRLKIGFNGYAGKQRIKNKIKEIKKAISASCECFLMPFL